MYIKLFGYLSFLWLVFGCASNQGDMEYKNIEAIAYADRVYLEQDQVVAYIKKLNTAHAKSINELYFRISNLNSRINAIESRASDKTTIEIVNSSDLVWVCTLSPTFEEKSFIAKATTKTEAIFKVVDRCLTAGVDDFYCKKDKVECSDK